MFSTSATKSIINTLLYQIFSKGIGYGKYVLFAFLFGTSMKMDAYNMALTILDISMFVFGHVFSVVGVPKLVEARKKSLTSFKRLSASIFTFSIVLAIVLIPLQYLLFDSIVSILASGFEVEKRYLTYEIFTYFLPMSIVYLPYFALISFFRSLNLFNISNFLDSLIAILSVIYLIVFLNRGIFVIPLSLSFAYVTTILSALYFAKKVKVIGFVGSINSPKMNEIYQNILKLSLWFLVLQLYRVVDKGFASLLDDGTISALVYASMLISGIGFIFDFAYVYLTKFSENDNKAQMFSLAIKLYLFLSIPIIIFLMTYSYEFIAFIYGSGEFDKKAINVTSSILFILSPLLCLSLVNGLFHTLYQSIQKYNYVIALSFTGVLLNFILNYFLVDEYGIRGITFSTLVSTIFILVINLFIMHFKESVYLDYRGIVTEAIKYFLVSSVSWFIVYMIDVSFIIEAILFFLLNFLMLVFLKNEFVIRIINIVRK